MTAQATAELQLAASLFHNRLDNVPRPWQGKFSELLHPHMPRPEKDGPAFCLAAYKPNITRSKEGVAYVTALCLDFDHLSSQRASDVWAKLKGRAFAAASTFSHRAGGEDDICFRVIFPINRTILPVEYPDVWRALFTQFDGLADRAAKDVSRIFYAPSCPPERAALAFIRFGDGEPLDVDELLERAAVKADGPAPADGPPPEKTNENSGSQKIIAAARRFLQEKIGPAIAGQGGQTRTFVAALRLVEGFALPLHLARQLLDEWNLTCVPPWTAAELAHKLADANNARSPEKTGELLRKFIPPTDLFPPILDAVDILSSPPPKPSQLIENILYRGGKLNINGPSKARKTFFQIHLGVCVATGTPWFNHCVVKGRVLYVNLELLPWSFFDRLRAITNSLGVSIEPHQFTALHLRGFRPTVESLEQYLSAAVADKDYSLIFFDPLYKILGLRDENAAGDMGDLLNRLEVIGRNAGAAVAFAHHFAKGDASNKDALDRSSGSGVLARDGDSIITLTPHETEDCFAMETILRDFPPIESSVLRWQFPLFIPDDSLNPADLKKPGKSGPDPSADDILAIISPIPKSLDELTDALRARTGRGINVCKAALRFAIKNNAFLASSTPRPNTQPLLKYSKKMT